MIKLDKKDFNAVFEIMEKSFPSDEYRPKDEQEALLLNPAYVLYGERHDEKLLGFMSVWNFDDFLYIEHFAVEPSLRSGGIGSKMIRELTAAQTLPYVLEVELPESEFSRRRIGFYERNGFIYNEYEYIQPPISKGKNAIPLRIMTSGQPISEKSYEHIRDTLYRCVYHTTVSELKNRM